MAGKDQNDVIKKFKTKVLGKLFGSNEDDPENEDIDTIPHDNSVYSHDPSVASSLSTLSGLGGELRAQEVRLYGAQCCPTGSRHRGHANEPLHMVGSSSYLSDDEGSKVDALECRRKRKQPHSPSLQMQRAQQAAESSSSSSMQETGYHTPMQVASSTGTSLTKNQKRKLKKKRKEKERRAINAPSAAEFTFDSSVNNCVILNESESQMHSDDYKQKWVSKYFQTLWESYSAERSLEDSELENFLTKLEECDPLNKDDGIELFTLVSTVMSQDITAADKQIEKFKEKTSLNSDLTNLIIDILKFWSRKNMKS